jgi:hypothetical protein
MGLKADFKKITDKKAFVNIYVIIFGVLGLVSWCHSFRKMILTPEISGCVS